MADAHTNGGYSTVLTAPSPASSGTSITIQSGDSMRFPTNPPFNVTIWPAGAKPLFANGANAEIARVVTVVGDTFTVLRQQEGTSARTILVGDQIAETITAKTLTDVETLPVSGDLSGNLPSPTVPAIHNVVKIHSLIGINHSYGAGTTQHDSGVPNVYQESYFAMLQGLLGVHEQNTVNVGMAGSYITQLLDGNGNPFSGWSGVAQYVVPSNSLTANAATDLVLYNPVVSSNGGAGVIVHGVNDYGLGMSGLNPAADDTQRATNNNAAAKNAYRFCISRLRSGAILGSYIASGTSSISWDSSLAFSASWNTNVASVTQNSGPAYRYATANNETVTWTVPTSYTGGTIAVNFVAQANGVTHTTGTYAASGAITVAVAANSEFPGSGTVVIKNVRTGEEMVVTAGLGSNNWTVNAADRGVNGTSAAAGNANDVIMVANDTYKVNVSGTAANATGSINLSGQGTFNNPVMVTKRFTVNASDAGKTFIFTVANIITHDTSVKVIFDSIHLESPQPAAISVANLHHWAFGGYLGDSTSYISAWNTMITQIVAEFDGFVQIADVYTPFYNRNGTITGSINSSVTTIGWTCNSTSFTPTVGMVMSFGGFTGEHVLVTGVSGSAPNWTLTVTRGFTQVLNNTTYGAAGSHSSGAFLGPMEWMSVDDIHPTLRGHGIYAEVIYDSLAAIVGLDTYQIAQSAGNWSQYSQTFQMGIVDNNWNPPPINGWSTLASGSNTQYAYPIYIPKACVMVGMTCTVSTGTTTTIRFGIYYPDRTHSRPGNLLQDFGAYTLTGTAPYNAQQTGFYQYLRPGWYWLSMAQQGSTATLRASGAGVGMTWPLLSSAAVPTSATGMVQGYKQTGITGAFADWTTWTESTQCPNIWYQLRAAQFS